MNKIIITVVFLISLFYFPTIAVQARTINFSNYTWQVKNGYFYPGPNYWNDSAETVFVDEFGRLNLTVSKINNQWKSTEIFLNKSLGYGTYEFIIESNISKIDKNLIAAPFIYADDKREFDIEFTRWGVEGYENLEYSVHPTANASLTNTKNFLLPSIDNETKHTIEWTPNYIHFRAYNGNAILSEWKYQGKDNFIPGDERVHINFWQLHGQAPASGKTEKIIFKSFSFKPLNSPVSDNTLLNIVPPQSLSPILKKGQNKNIISKKNLSIGSIGTNVKKITKIYQSQWFGNGSI